MRIKTTISLQFILLNEKSEKDGLCFGVDPVVQLSALKKKVNHTKYIYTFNFEKAFDEQWTRFMVNINLFGRF